jgi:cobalamin biosynthesis protein CobD/CbiB
MSKLDSKKELLNTLRAAFGIIVAIILTISAGLINLYYKDNIDILFYIGSLFVIIFAFSLLVIVKYIVKHIKEIGDL